MTARNKRGVRVPPEVAQAAQEALVGLGRIGAKALASGIKSVASDVRKKIREAEAYVAGVEGRAGRLADNEEE